MTDVRENLERELYDTLGRAARLRRQLDALNRPMRRRSASPSEWPWDADAIERQLTLLGVAKPGEVFTIDLITGALAEARVLPAPAYAELEPRPSRRVRHYVLDRLKATGWTVVRNGRGSGWRAPRVGKCEK